MEPKIIFEDADLLVVDKPAGMIVYPDGKHEYPALSHWLGKKYCRDFILCTASTARPAACWWLQRRKNRMSF